ncbi:DUF397 domain-containing protein [Actinoplanes sp. URMC 104]|uniref:DUF397 domain-containing protein n=1 Tax=Actinoplanes sp. URMC 104 TaxID=3423409 RepID=UPI003F1A4B8D
MNQPDFSAARWHKTNRSLQTNCVEVTLAGDVIGVRNSRDPGGPVLTFTVSEWRAFLGGVRDNEFELDQLGR